MYVLYTQCVVVVVVVGAGIKSSTKPRIRVSLDFGVLAPD